MNFKLTIEAPELVGAINNLAEALGSSGLPLPATAPATASKPAAVKQDKPVEEPAVKVDKPAEEPTPIEKANETKTETAAISLDVVRGKLVDFAKGGKPNQEKTKAALAELGVVKLTDVDPADYETLLEKVGLTV